MSAPRSSLFLTGATGFVGQALVRRFQQEGWAIRALVRSPTSAAGRWLVGRGVEVVRGDVATGEGVAAGMSGGDLVIHNAGVYQLGCSPAQVRTMHRANVTGTANVLDAALAQGVPKTLYVSTTWAQGATGTAAVDERFVRSTPYFSEYERTKAEAHQIALAARSRGLPLTIAMPNGVVGANDHSIFGYMLRLYLTRRLPPFAWGAQSIFTLVDVDALADGISRACEAPAGGEYLFCGPPQTLREMLEHWSRHRGGARKVIWLPERLASLPMAALEPLQRAVGLPAIFSRESVVVGHKHLNYCSTKAHSELGWEHPTAADMWDKVIHEQTDLIANQHGVLARLKPRPVANARPMSSGR